MKRLQSERDHFEEERQRYKEESKRLDQQLKRAHGLDPSQEKEEAQMFRDMRISDLESLLDEHEKEEQKLKDQLLRTEEKVLDLKFEKETFDLQKQRLEKRIIDLENYRLSSQHQSALQRQEQEQKKEDIADIVDAKGGKEKAKEEAVRLRKKPTKSVVELESLVDALQKLVDKLQTENKKLKGDLQEQEARTDKLKNQRELQAKISNLEDALHGHEMKELNFDEKERNLKKMEKANRGL